jgi:hypothetical protein
MVSIAVVPVPPTVNVDGDLREWGEVPPAGQSLPDPDTDGSSSKTEGASSRAPTTSLSYAPSRLAVALDGNGIWLAAELSESALDGVWLGVGGRVAAMPLPGQYFGNLGFVGLDCDKLPYFVDDGSPEQGYGFDRYPPPGQRACRALLARNASAKLAHEQRFARLLRIGRDGTFAVGGSSAQSTIQGSKVVIRSSGQKATLEASLPLGALPRFADAPITVLRVAARAVTGPEPPAFARRQWAWLKLPSAVSFEPNAEIRAHAFRHALDSPEEHRSVELPTYEQPRGASYDPADPLNMEVVECVESRLPDVPLTWEPPGDLQHNLGSWTCDPVARAAPLFQRMASLGSFDVGSLATPSDRRYGHGLGYAGILRKGKLVDSFELPGQPRGWIVRDGDLHILTYGEKALADVPGVWAVIAVSPDATHRPVVVEPVPGIKGEHYWSSRAAVVAEDMQTFGWRGETEINGERHVIEASFHWNPVRKLYVGVQRDLSPPSMKKNQRR